MTTRSTTSTPARPSRRGILRRLLWLVVLAAVPLIAVSLTLRHPRVAAALERRLSASVGRPVDVGSFDLSLWEGLRLRANFVTVAEDPRFGHEYFLLAERLTAGLRWTALLSGRIEFDSLVLTRPSLNLVRAADGQWNLENWLPWPAGASAANSPPPSPASPVRFQHMRIRNGRINFKRVHDKHPFALVAVDGSVVQAGEGRWDLDVSGRPTRSSVVVQQAGTIRVRGNLGGTSARLRPADLLLTWEAVSLSDALRLLAGQDYGVRGQMNLSGRLTAPAPLAAEADPAASQWSISGISHLTGVHRWDLPLRSTDPSLNVALDAQWWPAFARLELTRATVEAPGSLVRAAGFVQWGAAPSGRATGPQLSAQPDSRLHFVSSGISLDDLFRWYPAFRPGVSPDLAVAGHTGLDLLIAGWPLRFERLVMATGGARLRVPGLTDALAATGTVLRYERARGRVEFGPAIIRFGAPGAPTPVTALRVEAFATPGTPWKFRSNVSGNVADAQAVLHAASAFAISAPRRWATARWRAQGAADLRLAWEGTLFPFSAAPLGTIRLRQARLSTPALADSIAIAAASIELSPAGSRMDFQNVRALGATWNGSLRGRGAGPWDFTLSADTLDVAEAHRWLVPAVQQSLLTRLAGGENSRVWLFDDLAGFSARGRVQVQQLRMSPFVLGAMRGRITFDTSAPWRFELDDAHAGFFAGSLAGVFVARAAATEIAPQNSAVPAATAPDYVADLRLRGVSLAALTAAMPRLRGLFGGIGDGQITITARGFHREELLASLTAKGTVRLTAAQTTLLDLPASLRAGRALPGATALPLAESGFSWARRQLTLHHLQLFAPLSRPSFADWLVTGRVNTGAADIELDLLLTASQPLPPLAGDLAKKVAASPAPPLAVPLPLPLPREFRLRGPLRAIELTPQPPAPRP